MTEQRPSTTAGDQPMPPVANTRKARVDAIFGWYLELVALDQKDPEQAAYKAIEAAVTDDDGEGNPVVKMAEGFIIGCIVLLALAFIIPALLWFVGNVIVPLFGWGTSWI